MNLKNPNNILGNLMDIEYFIDINFNKLHNKYIELMMNNKPKIKEKLEKIYQNKLMIH